MGTSGESNVKYQKAYVPTTALARSLEFDEHAMRVVFTDARVLSVPLEWFPVLRRASPEQLKHYEIGGGGVSLHWPELDEDLSVAGLMAGVDWRSTSYGHYADEEVASMDNNRLDAWVRHYDSLLWTVTSILLAANSALLVYSYSSDNGKFVSGLAVGGLILTGLTVYFAASMRELRHRFQERNAKLKALIQKGRWLYQWPAFIVLFLLLIVGWTWLLCERAPAWRFLWFDLGEIVAIATLALGYLFARPANKGTDDADRDQEPWKLRQWLPFIAIALFLALAAAGGTWFFCAYAPAWRFLWFDLGEIVAIAAFLLAYFYARSAKKTTADAQTVTRANTSGTTEKGDPSQ